MLGFWIQADGHAPCMTGSKSLSLSLSLLPTFFLLLVFSPDSLSLASFQNPYRHKLYSRHQQLRVDSHSKLVWTSRRASTPTNARMHTACHSSELNTDLHVLILYIYMCMCVIPLNVGLGATNFEYFSFIFIVIMRNVYI